MPVRSYVCMYACMCGFVYVRGNRNRCSSFSIFLLRTSNDIRCTSRTYMILLCIKSSWKCDVCMEFVRYVYIMKRKRGWKKRGGLLSLFARAYRILWSVLFFVFLFYFSFFIIIIVVWFVRSFVQRFVNGESSSCAKHSTHISIYVYAVYTRTLLFVFTYSI